MNMMNNDVLRRIRYTFDFSDSEMIALFKAADLTVTREQVSAWLKKDEDPHFQNCEDFQLASFLNGFIVKKRGPKEGEPPKVEKSLTNNIILRKIMIALNLKSDDTLEILRLADFSLSPPELSAFFRKSDHKHYRACQDQILRNFLKGMQLKFRPSVN
jgi:uncharacterized protein YehS (DUF1456 family)